MQISSHLGPEKPSTTRRPGGRTSRTRDAVLAAARAEIAEAGYAATSLEKIALRAGVAPSTAYRRWTNLEGVLVDLAGEFTGPYLGPELPDTGTFDGDLKALAHFVTGLLNDPAQQALMGALVSAAVRDPSARETLTAIIASRIQAAQPVTQRAIDRGEIPTDTDPAEVIRAIGAPLYYRMFISGEPIGPEEADRAAAVAALAVHGGALTTRPD